VLSLLTLRGLSQVTDKGAAGGVSGTSVLPGPCVLRVRLRSRFAMHTTRCSGRPGWRLLALEALGLSGDLASRCSPLAPQPSTSVTQLEAAWDGTPPSCRLQPSSPPKVGCCCVQTLYGW
jgi:hypothetical protein